MQADAAGGLVLNQGSAEQQKSPIDPPCKAKSGVDPDNMEQAGCSKRFPYGRLITLKGRKIQAEFRPGDVLADEKR